VANYLLEITVKRREHIVVDRGSEMTITVTVDSMNSTKAALSYHDIFFLFVVDDIFCLPLFSPAFTLRSSPINNNISIHKESNELLLLPFAMSVVPSSMFFLFVFLVGRFQFFSILPPTQN
jgi:hypothetical protein